MKYSIAMPLGVVTPGEFQTPDAVQDLSVALERSGADAGYLTDHPAPSAAWLHGGGMGHDALDPFTAFASVAAATSRLKLHMNIIVMPYRNPFLTAKSAATLQVLSGGRLILGCGAGYMKAEFEALGVDFHKRGKLFDEALELMHRIWQGGPVEWQGSGFTATDNEARPVPDPPPAIWIGGGSDKAVERAARWGDGWCPFFAAPSMSRLNRDTGVQSVEHLGEKIARIRELRQEFGRTGPFEFTIGSRSRIGFGKPGGADAVLAETEELAAAGVDWMFLDPPHPSRQAWIENVQWFGEEVIGRG